MTAEYKLYLELACVALIYAAYAIWLFWPNATLEGAKDKLRNFTAYMANSPVAFISFLFAFAGTSLLIIVLSTGIAQVAITVLYVAHLMVGGKLHRSHVRAQVQAILAEHDRLQRERESKATTSSNKE